eukprot:SAG11_NODE_4257_length_1983_cov_1.038196_3_plen_80_part_00
MVVEEDLTADGVGVQIDAEPKELKRKQKQEKARMKAETKAAKVARKGRGREAKLSMADRALASDIMANAPYEEAREDSV